MTTIFDWLAFLVPVATFVALYIWIRWDMRRIEREIFGRTASCVNREDGSTPDGS